MPLGAGAGGGGGGEGARAAELVATLAESKGEAAAQRAALLALQQQLVDALLAAQPPDAADDAAAASSPVHRRAPGKSDEVGYVAWGGERWHATVRPPVAGGAPVLHAAKAGESVRPTELLLYERHGQRWQAQWLHGFFVSVPSGGAAAGGGGAGAPRPTIGRTLRYEDWGGEAKVWRPEAGAEGKAAG